MRNGSRLISSLAVIVQAAQPALAASSVSLAAESQEVSAVEGAGTRGGGLRYPNAAAVGSGGEVYVADSANNRIVVIPPGGQPKTLPIGADPKILPIVNDLRILPIDADTKAGMSNPQDIAVQEYNGKCKLLVADSDHNRVAIYSCDGKYIGEIKSAGSTALKNPQGVGVGRDGSVVIADTMNHVVHILTPDLNWRSTIGKGQLQFPKDAAVTSRGQVWVSDFENHRLVKFDPSGTLATAITAVGDKPLRHPVGLDVDTRDRLWAAVMDSSSVVIVDPDTGAAKSFGTYEDGRERMKTETTKRTPLGFDHPKGVAVGAGQVWIVTPGSHSIRSVKYGE